ncbi:amidohydrolase family protein [Kordiimonas aestuarii]|uniref:amidohydrolase family protein n=1 Tax=Kordiimonas aestuarii TaxID=1005925 RepID=UPI0021D16466|nr:amidohydrolase family protein [Kordiimonas aestuarii]
MKFGKMGAAAIALSVAMTIGSTAQAQKATGTARAYVGVALIDGTGAPLQEDMGVLVESDRITSVLPSGELKAQLPEGAKVVDASGHYLLPGLIDTHVHMATVPNAERAKAYLRRYIYSGITGVRDMAGDMRALAELARQSRLQKIPAPDLYYSALLAGPSFFDDPRPGMAAEGEVPGDVPWMQAITPDTDMKETVAIARGTWATGIKIYANLPATEVRRITAEGHRQGIKIWAHSMVFPAYPSEVVGAGVDVISHACRLAFEVAGVRPNEYHHKAVLDFASLDPRSPVLADIFEQMEIRGTILDATLWLYANREQREREKPEDKRSAGICPSAFAGAMTRFAYESGVDISAGTDGMLGYDAEYPALFDELEVLAEKAEMPPLQVIRSATYVGARVLGLEDDRGTIEAGKRADLIFLSKNPLEDMANMRSVVLTVKGGTDYPREAYAPPTKAELEGEK